jgi:hypothetical protein
MPQLTTDDLYALRDDDVLDAVRAQFAQQLKNSPSVKATFFATEAPALSPADTGSTDELATALVCSSIGSSSLYGFSKCINAPASDQFWQGRLVDSNAQAVVAGQQLYQTNFPDLCRSKNASFRDYQRDGGTKWAAALAGKVTADPFINTEMQKILAQPGWLAALNLVFFKIQQLDPQFVDGVLDKWNQAYPDKSIARTWDHKTFIPYQNFTQVPDQFIGSVNSAIAVKTQTDRIYIPGQGGMAATGEHTIYEYTYGINVQNFLGSSATRLGLTTGASPDNKMTVNDTPSASFGCFLAGTRVRLADGREVPIEAIRDGDLVLGKDGGDSRHSDEKVVMELEHGEFVYGIDDGQLSDTPFFSGGHVFWTDGGWKAIDPATALRENPSRPVTGFKPGDVVYRLESVNPTSYQEVRIRAFTRTFVAEGTRLYGLHLVDGPHSYHANDYLVGMNYPQLTVQRLADAIARLSEPEQRHLERCLKECLPALSHAMGSFLEAGLRGALDRARAVSAGY